MKPAEVSTPSDREVLVKRSFDAPVNLVWQAYTDPALMRRWLTAMPGWSMPVCEMATHVGGKYRWRWRDNENGQEFGFTGEMLEVALHSKIVHTQIYDPGDWVDRWEVSRRSSRSRSTRPTGSRTWRPRSSLLRRRIAMRRCRPA